MKLYRILRKTAGSLQPGSGQTFWNVTVLYCGYDRLEALRVYHESSPADVERGYGHRCVRTVAQSKEVLADNPQPQGE